MRTLSKSIGLWKVRGEVAGALVALGVGMGLGGGVAPCAAAGPAAEWQPKNPEFLRQFAETRGFSLGRPTAISVTPQGDAVLFLRGTGPRSFVQDLWLLDVASGQERVLLTAEQVLAGEAEVLTAEELARRERARSASRGIAQYALSKDGNRLLVPLSGRLFVIEIADRATPRVRELTSEAGYPIDPRLTPDGTRVVCAREGDLYVMDVESGRETRLTTGATEHVTHGLAEFVAQEEMGRSAGYWVSPDSALIAYQRTDTSALETFAIADPANPGKPAQTWPYPRAGKANAEVTLGVMRLPEAGESAGETVWVRWDRERYPYLAHVSWAEGGPLTILVQNRAQTEQVLLRVDAASGETAELLRETDPAWINIYGDQWVPGGAGFVWTTEQDASGPIDPSGSDRARVELRRPDGAVASTLFPGDADVSVLGFSADGERAMASVRSGYTGNQLQWISLSDAATGGITIEDLAPLTQHGAVLSRASETWVHTVSREDGTVGAEVRRRWVGPWADAVPLRSVAEEPPFVPRVEYQTVTVEGVEIEAVVIRPRDVDPTKKYPVLNAVYGGPGSNRVIGSRRAYLLNQWMADQGFVVVALDARGTPGKGRAWERAIKGDVIEIPLKEQAAGILALCARYPEMDAERIGIYGWSFGGYFSAMAACRRPDVFKAAVAGAPVIDWRDYDTHYTERYMGMPEENAAGYDAASVLTYAKDLRVPLMIIHGTADDNVYMINSLRLTDALFRAGRPFEFVPLSGFTHAVNEPAAVERLWSRVAGFFVRELGGAE